MRTWIALPAALALFLSAGCTTVGIDSIPQGAKVLVDGKWNGAVTPARIPIRDLPRGVHTITVEKEGYKMVSPPPQVTIATDTIWIWMTLVPPPGPVIILPGELAGNLWKRAEDTHGQVSFGQMCLPLDTSVLLKETPDAGKAAAGVASERLVRQLGERSDPFDVPFFISVRDAPLREVLANLVAQVNRAKLDPGILKSGVLYFSAVELTADKDAVGKVTCNLPCTTFKAALDAFLRPNGCAWTCSKEQKSERKPFAYVYKIRVSRDVERVQATEISQMKPDLPKLLVAEESSLTVARWRNEMLADAKDQQLPALLRDSKTADLIDLAGKIEHTILECARQSEALAEQSGQAAEPAASQAPDEQRQLSQALKERIKLLAPILDAINVEIANRSK